MIAPAATARPPAAVTAPAQSTLPDCNAVLVLTARGSGEPLLGSTDDNRTGEGKTLYSAVQRLESESLAKFEVQTVNYPAQDVTLLAVNPAQYFAGLNQGFTETLADLNQAVAACPDQRIVLAGYSQGAMVMHRVLRQLAASNSPILTRVLAALLVGDGDRVAGDPVSYYGSADEAAQGVGLAFPALSGSVSNRFNSIVGSRVYSVCNTADPVCDNSTGDVCNAPNSIVPKQFVNTIACTAVQFAYALFKQFVRILNIPNFLAIHEGYTGSPELFAAVDQIAHRIASGPQITSTTLPAGIVGQPYTAGLTTADNRNGIWSITSGSLPQGLTLQGNTIIGTPTNPQQATFEIFFIDTYSQTATSSESITVSGPLTYTTSTLAAGTGPAAVAVAAGTHTAYVTNCNYSGTVTVIDTSTNTVTGTISVPNGAHSVAVDTSAHTAYFTSAAMVTVIDTSTNTVAGTIPLDINPGAVAVDKGAHRLYVASHYGSKVSVIDTNTNTVTGTLSVGNSSTYLGGVAIDASTHTAYVIVYVVNGDGSSGAGTLATINTMTQTVSGSIPVGLGPFGVAVDETSHTAYVTNFGPNSGTGTGTVSLIDTSTNAIVNNLIVGNDPEGVAVDETSHTAYVANLGSNTVSVIQRHGG